MVYSTGQKEKHIYLFERKHFDKNMFQQVWNKTKRQQIYETEE